MSLLWFLPLSLIRYCSDPESYTVILYSLAISEIKTDKCQYSSFDNYFLFLQVNYVFQHIRESNLPMGGVQLILVGDYRQVSLDDV